MFAFGEAADLADRALELWPRVPDPEQVAGVSHVDLLQIGSRAHGDAGERTRAESLCGRRCASSGRARIPRATPTCWRGCRGRSGCSTRAPRRSRRASVRWPSCPRMSPSACEPLILAWLARMRFLRGNFQDAVADGERALELAVAAGDRESEIQPAEHARDVQGPPQRARRGGRAAAPRDRGGGRGRGSRRHPVRVREPGRHARPGGAQRARHSGSRTKVCSGCRGGSRAARTGCS